jgi:UDP-glucose 4-epimerase
VDDVVDALLLAAKSDQSSGQSFNLGAPDPISLVDLAKLTVEIAGSGSYELVPFPPEAKRIDIGDYFADYGRIYTTLGWQPNTSLADGLARTIEFYRKHAAHYWSSQP